MTSPEKLKTMLMQTFWGVNKVYDYGIVKKTIVKDYGESHTYSSNDLACVSLFYVNKYYTYLLSCLYFAV